MVTESPTYFNVFNVNVAEQSTNGVGAKANFALFSQAFTFHGDMGWHICCHGTAWNPAFANNPNTVEATLSTPKLFETIWNYLKDTESMESQVCL